MLSAGRPGAHADAGARLGERLRDREAEAAVVGDAGDERAAAGEVDVEHHAYYDAGACRPGKG